ncbi:hypothetical protein F3Y22_tig00113725pilonHSYRG01370 [Hibiscus syriacus]|uniref:DUF4283 domain-containing protein n=1 Tax=Hibiscus syriacus TaxID=106335 RepID=A0A6A2X3K9_HIBSY|nr:hypothetical protein F3Y22_tig00113725pilonHSYRG01370 [Hibiscus syriacus]
MKEESTPRDTVGWTLWGDRRFTIKSAYASQEKSINAVEDEIQECIEMDLHAWLAMNLGDAKGFVWQAANWDILFGILIWCIWLHRTSIAFDMALEDNQSVLEQEKNLMEVTYLALMLGSLHKTSKLSCSVGRGLWKRPNSGWTKVNLDGVINRENGFTDYEGIIRGHEGISNYIIFGLLIGSGSDQNCRKMSAFYLWIMGDIKKDMESLELMEKNEDILVFDQTSSKPLVSFYHCLVGRFLTTGSINLQAMENVWHRIGVISITELGEGRYLFRLYHEAARQLGNFVGTFVMFDATMISLGYKMFCFLCGMLRHGEGFCSLRILQSKQNLVPQSGASLKAPPSDPPMHPILGYVEEVEEERGSENGVISFNVAYSSDVGGKRNQSWICIPKENVVGKQP